MALYWRTAYPTITWWDSAQYSVAAGTLGVVGPPGSLLLTLLGWPVAHLPFGSSPAHRLNLLAGALAALAALLVYAVALRALRMTGSVRTLAEGNAAATGATLGTLTFAFGAAFWPYAVQFTPYVLTVVFTGLILWSMVRWWEDADRPDAWRWLGLLGLLFGLDCSVHRTNALLLPAALGWILLRRPRALRSRAGVLAGVAGLLAGLGVQLLIIPIAIGAMTRSPLFWNDPTNWSRFWDYTSLRRLGGGFLLDLLPRKAPFWSVQVADLIRVLGASFLRWDGPLGALRVLPALTVVLGLATLWRRNRRLGAAFAITVVLQAALTVLYFNIPAHFFRTFDRHYLPVCLTIAVLMVYGLAAAMTWIVCQAASRRWVAAIPACVVVLAEPVSQVAGNWSAADASRRVFTGEFATNLLTSLPPGAILFTVGDNDTFPLLYFQAVEGVRRDVTVVNLSVANLPAFATELLRREPAFPLSFSRAEREVLAADSTPTTFTIPVRGSPGSLGLPAGAAPPDSITVVVKPQYGARMFPADITLADVVITNRWRRPVCFAVTATRGAMAGFAPYGRLEGLYWRLVPVHDPPVDIPLLRANLLERADYRGYADRSVRLDSESRTLGIQPYVALALLLEAERKSDNIGRCRADAAVLLKALPPDRLGLPAAYHERIGSACATSR